MEKVLSFSSAVEKATVIKIWVISLIFYDKCRCLSKIFLSIYVTCFKVITEKKEYFLNVKEQTSPVLYTVIVYRKVSFLQKPCWIHKINSQEKNFFHLTAVPKHVYTIYFGREGLFLDVIFFSADWQLAANKTHSHPLFFVM